MLPRMPADHNPKVIRMGVNNRGSALIGVVIAMVIVGAMGGIMVTMNATSSVNQFGSMDGFRAFYLAESGGRYAIPVINKNIDAPDTLIPLLDGHTFSFSNGDSFQLSLSYAEPVYTLVSTGILNQGPRELHATREITYRITKLGVTIDMPFDDDKDGKKEFKENFEFDGKKGKIKDKKKELDGTGAVELKGDDTYMRLNWTNNDATLPNLAAHWLKNGELLSYDVQVKIKIMEDLKKKKKKDESPEFLVGLSFRDTGVEAFKDAGSDMYGLSFLKLDDCSDKDSLPADFCSWGLSSETLYVVLWKNTGGTYSLIDSHEITDGNLLDGELLTDWASLVVRVEEEYVLDVNGNRQDLDGDGHDDRRNLISGYMQGADAYPRDTIDWDFTLYQDIPWDSGTANPLIDSSLTTETFGDDRPPEIGVHTFVNKDYVDKVYVDDLSIQLNSSLGSPSSVVQY
jgi:hypothetical protein